MTFQARTRLAIAGVFLTVPLGAVSSQAQPTGDTTASRATDDRPLPKRVPIAKSVFGDAGMIVNARDDGFIEIAAAGPNKTVLLQLRTMAARSWVDSTTRMLRARVRRSSTPRTYRSDIEEAGTSTTMALTRKVTNGESEYSLFFSDDPLSGFSVPIQRSEADVFVGQVRRAVALSAKLLERPDSTKQADSAAKAKKPAPKPTARPTNRPPATRSAPKAPAQPAAKTTTPA